MGQQRKIPFGTFAENVKRCSRSSHSQFVATDLIGLDVHRIPVEREPQSFFNMHHQTVLLPCPPKDNVEHLPSAEAYFADYLK